MQPCVVEKVVVLALPALAVRHDLHNSWRQTLPGQLVVDGHSDSHLPVLADQVRDVHLEWGVAPFMFDHLRLVDPDGGAVRCCVETENDSVALPPSWHLDDPLVPHVPHMVVHSLVRENVVEAAGNGHRKARSECRSPPLLRTSYAIGVNSKLPESVQPFGLAASVILRTEHRSSLS